jgi:hypothetical protein
VIKWRQVLPDHSGHHLHWFNFGPDHMGTPLTEHGRYDMNLFAGQNLPQLLAAQPSPGGSLGGEVSPQHVQIRTLACGQLALVLEQGPTQPLQRRIGLLFSPTHHVHGRRRVCDHVKFVEGDPRLRQSLRDSLDKGRRHVGLAAAICSTSPP